MYHDITVSFGDVIKIGDDIEVRAMRNYMCFKTTVKIGVDAPGSILIMRHELLTAQGNKQ